MIFWDDQSERLSFYFENRLRDLLDSRCLTGADLEDAGVVSASSVKEYLENGRLPNLRTACKIADFFDVDLDWLCGREDNIDDMQPLATVRDFEKERIAPWKK